MTKCYRCDALYDETIKWVYGWQEKDRTDGGGFHRTGSVKDGDCPICRKPPLLEKPLPVMPM